MGEKAGGSQARFAESSAFGLDRCMWGSDWTRTVKLLTYAEGLDAFRFADLSDGDRANLMGGRLAAFTVGRRREHQSYPGARTRVE